MKLRKMKENDLEEVYRLGIKVDGFSVSDKSRFYSKKNLKGWIKNGDDVLMVAEDKNKIVGFFMSQANEHTQSAILSNIWINENYRGKGVGRKLLKEGLRQLRAKGIFYIYAQVKLKNKDSVKFFESAGFKGGYDFTWMELAN